MKMLLVKGYHIPSLNKRNLIMQYVERSIKIKGNELPVGHDARDFRAWNLTRDQESHNLLLVEHKVEEGRRPLDDGAMEAMASSPTRGISMNRRGSCHQAVETSRIVYEFSEPC